MKKLLAILLALTLMLGTTSAFAATLDLSYVRNRVESIYTISVNKDSDVAFITTQLAVSARAYEHKYESQYRYNDTEFDVLVVNYSKSSAVPVFRLWVSYAADNSYLYVNAITFDVAGTKYTFTDVSDYEWYTHDDKGYQERMLIKFDMDNVGFILALEQLIPKISQISSAADYENLPLTMTLHGTEDITVQLGSGFCLDFISMKDAYLAIGGIEFLTEVNGTPMTTK